MFSRFGIKKTALLQIECNPKKSEKGNDTSDNANEKLIRKPDDEPKKKKEMNLDNVKCFNYGNKGHYVRDCLENESDDEDQFARPMLTVLIKDEGDCFAAGTGGRKNLCMYEIILDSGSQVNCMHPRFLQDLREGYGGFRGLYGTGKEINKIGRRLAGFFDCLAACEDAKARLISLADVEDLYQVTYTPKEGYIVHMNDRDLVFKRRNKLYVAGFSDWIDQEEYKESYAAICIRMTVDE